MNVLVVGSGGREHALCWRLAASPLLGGLWCAPGNAGIENEARCVALDPMDFDGVVAFCREESIDFVVVGPEAPLVAGLVDRLEAEGIAAFGPRAAAARRHATGMSAAVSGPSSSIRPRTSARSSTPNGSATASTIWRRRSRPGSR